MAVFMLKSKLEFKKFELAFAMLHILQQVFWVKLFWNSYKGIGKQNCNKNDATVTVLYILLYIFDIFILSTVHDEWFKWFFVKCARAHAHTHTHTQQMSDNITHKMFEELTTILLYLFVFTTDHHLQEHFIFKT